MKELSFILMGMGIAMFVVALITIPDMTSKEQLMENAVQMRNAGLFFMLSALGGGLSWLFMFLHQVEP